MSEPRRKIATSVRWHPGLMDELKAAAAAAGLPMSTCLHLAVRCWLDGRQRGARLDEVEAAHVASITGRDVTEVP